ncbi:MAG: NfeD family protein, partial [Actinomycetia bacterium]|nr:NfeD family protein [Actinomycetes bacterium]
SVGWQWAAFIVISTIAFFSMRRLSDRLTHDPPVKTGSDRLIGKAGIVLERLVPDCPEGEVRISREIWRADAPGHGVVPAGTRVIVDGIEGTHLIVHPEVEHAEGDTSEPEV